MRRDFTINGMAYDLSKQILIDHVEGMRDIENKLVQTIGNPKSRFMEDGLRPIRGCRFAATLEFQLSENTKTAMQEALHVIQKIAMERFYDEWHKTLTSPYKHIFWSLLHETRITSLFLNHFEFLASAEKYSMLLQLLKHMAIQNMGMYLACFFYCETNMNASYPLKKKIESIGRKFKFPSKDIKNCLSYLTSPFLCFKKRNNLSIIKDHQIKLAASKISISELKYHIHFLASIMSFENTNYSTEKINQFFNDRWRKIRLRKEPVYLKEMNLNGTYLVKLGYAPVEIGKELNRLHKIIIRFALLNKKKYLQKFALKHKKA